MWDFKILRKRDLVLLLLWRSPRPGLEGQATCSPQGEQHWQHLQTFSFARYFNPFARGDQVTVADKSEITFWFLFSALPRNEKVLSE